MLSEHESMTLRSDLLDCHVDICSPEVLWRFSENFDYLELRKGFLASEVGVYVVMRKRRKGCVERPHTHTCTPREAERLFLVLRMR